jgi:hypothetical protein
MRCSAQFLDVLVVSHLFISDTMRLSEKIFCVRVSMIDPIFHGYPLARPPSIP